MEGIAAVEDIVWADNFLYYIDIFDRSMIGELARTSVDKNSNTVRLLRCNCHICYVSNVDGLLKASRPSCNECINRAPNLEWPLTTWKERVKLVFPKYASHLRETLIDILDSFNIPHSDNQKLFKNMAKFAFESTFVQ